AIAAVAAAAAEYGRQCGAEQNYPQSGFSGLQKINEQLGSSLRLRDTEHPNKKLCEVTFLQNLFQPTPCNSGLFNLVLTLFTTLQAKDRRSRPWPLQVVWVTKQLSKVELKTFASSDPQCSSDHSYRKFNPFMAGVWKGALVAIFLALLVTFVALLILGHGSTLLSYPNAAILALVLGLPLSAVGMVLGGWISALRALSQTFKTAVVEGNKFGFCSGINGDAAVPGTPALTQWLHTEVINPLANPALDHPLTFGDLETKGIVLRMVTSNLSQNIPYILPIQKPIFIFNAKEFNDLFPADVVDFMIKNPGSAERKLPKGYHFLPDAQNLPVVVATRMSLSFPLLFSAIPLHTVKATAEQKAVLEESDLQCNWFSDGGISSNFPIHFFDGWIPGRPTFGINLGTFQTAPVDSQKAQPQSLLADLWSILCDDDAPPSLAVEALSDADKRVVLPAPDAKPELLSKTLDNDLLGFLGAIFSTAQNYRDTMQSMLSGYKERIVEIKLDDSQGGLNLSMSPEVIETLLELGQIAGDQLCNRFDFDHHRWIRLKTMMGLLETQLDQVATAVKTYQFDYQKLLADQQHLEGRTTFPFAETDQKWNEDALRRIGELKDLIQKWTNDIKLALDKLEPVTTDIQTRTNDTEPLDKSESVATNNQKLKIIKPVFHGLEPLATDQSVLRVTPPI
ncbi:MAG TPA: hypothetical protein V6D19_05545, partial [Stenomitos sp.]